MESRWKIIAIVLSVAAGCAKKAESPSAAATKSTFKSRTGTSITLPQDASGAATAIEGSWAKSCANSAITVIGAAGSTFVYGQVNYADTGCTTANYTMATYGTFTVGSALSSPAGAYNLDYTLVGTVIQPESAAAASALNSSSFCGLTNWAAGTALDVTGKSCSGVTMAPAGTLGYDIFTVSGSTLTFGDTSGSNDGTTSAKRPTTLDSSAYTKVQ